MSNLKLTWTTSLLGTSRGVDADAANPFARTCRALLRSGETCSHLTMVLFQDPKGDLRWLGVFAETTTHRLLFFPGFSEVYRYIQNEHRGAKFGTQALVDHLALDEGLTHWSIVSGDSGAEQRIDQTTPLGRKRVLWVGMTIKGPKFLRSVRASTVARELTRGARQEVQDALSDATRFAGVEVVTVHPPRSEAYKQALHFAVVVGGRSSPLYRGRVLAIPDEPGPFMQSQPGSPFTFETRTHRVALSGSRALQVVTVWVPADMTANVGFTCPGKIPFRAKVGLFFTTITDSLRSFLAGRPDQRTTDSAKSPHAADTAHREAPSTRELKYWVKPPATLPIKKSPLRFAVGTPDGASSASWVLLVEKKGDVYVKCRDSFNEWKVSLHASGRWRLGLTAEAIKERPQLVPPGVDRAWDKWSPPPDHATKAVLAFQIVFPSRDLYVTPAHREGDKALLFVEPHPDPAMMTVISVFVVPSLDPIVGGENAPVGGVLGVIPLAAKRSVQLVAHYDEAARFEAAWDETIGRMRVRLAEGGGGNEPADLLILVNGIRDGAIRWVGTSLLGGESSG